MPETTQLYTEFTEAEGEEVVNAAHKAVFDRRMQLVQQAVETRLERIAEYDAEIEKNQKRKTATQAEIDLVAAGDKATIDKLIAAAERFGSRG